MGTCALHTVIGQNSRRRKALEPLRRLSETNSRNLQARSTLSSGNEDNKHATRWKCSAAFFTHGAPQVGIVISAHKRRRTCSRNARMNGAGTDYRGDGSPFTCYRERADMGGAPVTAASAVRARWTDAEVGGANGAAAVVRNTLPDAATAGPHGVQSLRGRSWHLDRGSFARKLQAGQDATRRLRWRRRIKRTGRARLQDLGPEGRPYAPVSEARVPDRRSTGRCGAVTRSNGVCRRLRLRPGERTFPQ